MDLRSFVSGPSSRWPLLLGYAGVVVVAGLCAVAVPLPFLLSLCAIPIPLVPLYHPRWVYLGMSASLTAAALGVAWWVSPDLGASAWRIGVQMLAVVGITEVVIHVVATRDAAIAIAARNEADERHRSIIEGARMVPWEVELPSGRCVYVGPGAEAMLGYSPERWYEENFWPEHIHPGDRERTIASCESAVFEQRDHEFEFRMLAADGRELWMRDFISVVMGPAGPVGLRGVMVDVTELHSAQNAMLASEERLSRIYAAASDGIITVDPETERIVEINPAGARMLGYPSEQLVGAPIKSDDVALFRSFTAEVMAKRAVTTEMAIHTSCGEMRIADVSGSVVVADGHSLVLAIVRDITERRRAEAEHARLEEQVRYAQKLESLAVLAGGIAHDFNNILVGILGNASLALEEIPRDSPAFECIEDLELAAEKASDLTRQMLAYAGKGKFEVLTLDLNAVVEENSQLVSAAAKLATLELELDSDPVWVEADPSQIRQVVMNLVTNASESMRDAEGRVRLRTGVAHRDFADAEIRHGDFPGEDCAFLEVSDTGLGMDGETLDAMFDPFFTTKFSGRGLGLAAVLGIARGHGGAIRVSSAPGRGTTIRMLLPLARSTSRAPSVVPRRTKPLGNGAILIADDEPHVMKVATAVIERAGFEVLCARNGLEAVELFRENADTLRAVLLDMTMPGASGEEVLARIREIHAEIPVVLMSGYSEEDFGGCTASGATAFLEKPFRSKQLISLVRSVIGA